MRVRELPQAILSEIGHRPYALPTAPWIQRQSWLDFLLMHWALPPEAVRPLVPPELELDLYDGKAWVGVVPFHMEGVTLRRFPDIPGFSAFPELNVRTYVKAGGRSGVYFLSLDASSALAVFLARAWYLLPYFRADMRYTIEGDVVEYHHRRTHRGAPPCRLDLRYGPVGPRRLSAVGSLEHFLVERYALFVVDRRKRILRGDVHHRPWPVQDAEIEVLENTMPQAHGLQVDGRRPDHVMYSTGVDVVVWRLVPVTTTSATPG